MTKILPSNQSIMHSVNHPDSNKQKEVFLLQFSQHSIQVLEFYIMQTLDKEMEILLFNRMKKNLYVKMTPEAGILFSFNILSFSQFRIILTLACTTAHLLCRNQTKIDQQKQFCEIRLTLAVSPSQSRLTD